MNIFTVLASSPRMKFPEEQTSALLAWLLHPEQDHGLGYRVIAELLREIAIKSPEDQLASPQKQELIELADRLGIRLRSDDIDRVAVQVFLEFNANNTGTFIDIILKVDYWVVAIENKIYAGSVSTNQLKREYEGLIVDPRMLNSVGTPRVLMVYLVPDRCKEAESEFESLKIQSADHAKVFATWKADDVDNTPSITAILDTLLQQDVIGKVVPMYEYVRHTLKALQTFIADDFDGFPYTDGRQPSSGINALTEARLSLSKITAKTDGYVGVQGGVVGLLGDVASGKVHKHQYQYSTSSELDGQKNWLPVQIFKQIVALETPGGDWSWCNEQLVLKASLILFFARQYPSAFYVGVRGGKKALQTLIDTRKACGDPSLDNEDAWSIRTDISHLSRKVNWMSADEFRIIVD